MPHTVSVIDRLRIERAVWDLDQRLYDLPRRSRIEKRREVRLNLLQAARDLGTTAALRNLGGTQRLAHDYLAAEFGDQPRHSWIAAAVFTALLPLLLDGYLRDSQAAFVDGVHAANPQVTGVFVTKGIDYLQDPTSFTFTAGQWSSVGGAWIFNPLPWVVWIVGAILAGRLWRLWPQRRAGDASEVRSSHP